MNNAALTQPHLSPDAFTIEVSLESRDRLKLEVSVADGEIKSAKLSGSGCAQMLRLLGEWRPKLKGAMNEVPLPKGDDHSAILLRELLLKAQGKWVYPYQDDEICHCRAVSTAKVDAAIVGGCRSAFSVARETSAGTSCGTCRTDIEAILRYRTARS